MTHSAIASRYAGALVDVATASSSGVDPQQVQRDLANFAEVFAGSPELRNALMSPAVPAARKRAVIGSIGEKLGVSRITRNFLFVLSDRRRIAELPEIVEAFELLLDERLGFIRAEISSAGELDERQQNAVAQQFERLTGKKVRTRFSVDRSLLGGLIARIGSTVYDGSVRGQLAALGERLSAE